MLDSTLLLHNLRSRSNSRLFRRSTETGLSCKIPILSAFSTTIASSSGTKALFCGLSGSKTAVLSLSCSLSTLTSSGNKFSRNSGNGRFDSGNSRSLCLFPAFLLCQSLLFRLFFGLCSFFLGSSFRFLLF